MMKTLDIVYFQSTLARVAMKSTTLLPYERKNIIEGYKYYLKGNIFEFAKGKKILPFVANLLCKLELDEVYWRNIYNNFESRNISIIEILNIIFGKFKIAQVNKVFVYENFGAVLTSDTLVGCFASGDVDLYADRSFQNSITEILKREGFEPANTNFSEATVSTEYINETFLEEGFRINIMWKPLSRIKLPFPINIDSCVQWDKLVTYKKTNILLPGIDALMYLCLLHISVHGFHRSPDIRLYTDTDRVALKKPDWEKIAVFARDDKTEVRTATAAILTHKLLGMPLPVDWISKYTKKHKQINRLLKRVYDSENNYLRDEPKGLSVLLIEILSSDSYWVKAVIDILFPSKKWINEYYLHGRGPLITGYIMHFRNLIK